MGNLIFIVKSSVFMLMMGLMVSSTTFALAESPSPLYLKVMQRWAKVTNFAENASQVAVDKFEHDLKKDPKIAPYVTSALLLDLQQFFYELFNAQDTMIALGKVYSEYYTIDELQSLIEFYETPAGKKLISTWAELTNKTQEIGDQLLKARERDYIEIIAKHIKKNAPELESTQTE